MSAPKWLEKLLHFSDLGEYRLSKYPAIADDIGFILKQDGNTAGDLLGYQGYCELALHRCMCRAFERLDRLNRLARREEIFPKRHLVQQYSAPESQCLGTHFLLC